MKTFTSYCFYTKPLFESFKKKRTLYNLTNTNKYQEFQYLNEDLSAINDVINQKNHSTIKLSSGFIFFKY
jgi:hypothetical protein